MTLLNDARIQRIRSRAEAAVLHGTLTFMVWKEGSVRDKTGRLRGGYENGDPANFGIVVHEGEESVPWGRLEIEDMELRVPMEHRAALESSGMVKINSFGDQDFDPAPVFDIVDKPRYGYLTMFLKVKKSG